MKLDSANNQKRFWFHLDLKWMQCRLLFGAYLQMASATPQSRLHCIYAINTNCKLIITIAINASAGKQYVRNRFDGLPLGSWNFINIQYSSYKFSDDILMRVNEAIGETRLLWDKLPSCKRPALLPIFSKNNYNISWCRRCMTNYHSSQCYTNYLSAADSPSEANCW